MTSRRTYLETDLQYYELVKGSKITNGLYGNIYDAYIRYKDNKLLPVIIKEVEIEKEHFKYIQINKDNNYDTSAEIKTLRLTNFITALYYSSKEGVPNFPILIKNFNIDNKIYLVEEKLESTFYDVYLSLEENQLISSLLQIFITLRHLHINGILHGDLHLMNIMRKKTSKKYITYYVKSNSGKTKKYMVRTNDYLYIIIDFSYSVINDNKNDEEFEKEKRKEIVSLIKSLTTRIIQNQLKKINKYSTEFLYKIAKKYSKHYYVKEGLIETLKNMNSESNESNNKISDTINSPKCGENSARKEENNLHNYTSNKLIGEFVWIVLCGCITNNNNIRTIVEKEIGKNIFIPLCGILLLKFITKEGYNIDKIIRKLYYFQY